MCLLFGRIKIILFRLAQTTKSCALIKFGCAAIIYGLGGICAWSADAPSAPVPPPSTPGLIWMLPFILLLLCIAICPLVPKIAHWWEHNRFKLAVALGFGLITAIY